MTQMKETYLPSKPRYEILDGLRGVAALLVVCYHLLEAYFEGGPQQPINHGYLAVDFFFVLSGFVIGYAYDDRWDRMSLTNFFKRRITRLHPMVIMGTLVGVLLFYLGDCSDFPLVARTEWWQVLLVALVGITMIPLSPGMDIRGWGETYPLNGPQWSLMWEYLANILYALVIRRFPKWLLMAFVALSALLTLNLALNIDVGGILEPRAAQAFTVVGGWSTDPDQLLIGITRLLYPFFMGLLLSRMHWLIRLRAGFWWCSLAVVAALAMPHITNEANSLPDGIYQAVAILVVFPLIVSAGAGSHVTGRSARLCIWLGRLSFPLYITHYPIVYAQRAWHCSHASLPVGVQVMFFLCCVVASVLLAQACLKLYDEPVRRWLKIHWLHAQPKQAQ